MTSCDPTVSCNDGAAIYAERWVRRGEALTIRSHLNGIGQIEIEIDISSDQLELFLEGNGGPDRI